MKVIALSQADMEINRFHIDSFIVCVISNPP